MAHVSSLHSISSRPPFYQPSSSSSFSSSIKFKLGVEKCRNQQQHHRYLTTLGCRCSVKNEHEYGNGRQRRDVLLQTVVTLFSFPILVSPAFAENDDFRIFSDDVNKFKISIPQEWQVGGGGESNGFKSITAFYPQETSSTSNVSVVITGLGADFTRMESFGKVESFAENLVSGLDRSWQRPPGVTAKLIDSKSSKGFYYIEYTLQNPGESCRHIYTAIGMATNGWYNRLYTVTGQFLEEESNIYSSNIQKAIASFGFI